MSAQLSADRTALAGEKASLESVVDRLEDAVAVVNTRGELLFANRAIRAFVPGLEPGLKLTQVLKAGSSTGRARGGDHRGGASRGPIAVRMDERAPERLRS